MAGYGLLTSRCTLVRGKEDEGALGVGGLVSKGPDRIHKGPVLNS